MPQTVFHSLTLVKADQVKAWCGQLEFVGFKQGTLRLRAHSKFAQRYIKTHLTRPIFGAVEAEMGPVARIKTLAAWYAGLAAD